MPKPKAGNNIIVQYDVVICSLCRCSTFRKWKGKRKRTKKEKKKKEKKKGKRRKRKVCDGDGGEVGGWRLDQKQRSKGVAIKKKLKYSWVKM